MTFATAILLASGIVMAGGDTTGETAALDVAGPGLCTLEAASSDATVEFMGRKHDPPTTPCCNPALEPSVNGNPICYEGHSCCEDGLWHCNSFDGTPTCFPGPVCPEGCHNLECCAVFGEACMDDGECCGGRCRGGRCR